MAIGACSLDNLPREILALGIGIHLPLATYGRLQQVCKSIPSFTDEPLILRLKARDLKFNVSHCRTPQDVLDLFKRNIQLIRGFRIYRRLSEAQAPPQARPRTLFSRFTGFMRSPLNTYLLPSQFQLYIDVIMQENHLELFKFLLDNSVHSIHSIDLGSNPTPLVEAERPSEMNEDILQHVEEFGYERGYKDFLK